MKRIKKLINEIKYDAIIGAMQGYFSVAMVFGVFGAFVSGLMKAGAGLG